MTDILRLTETGNDPYHELQDKEGYGWNADTSIRGERCRECGRLVETFYRSYYRPGSPVLCEDCAEIVNPYRGGGG